MEKQTKREKILEVSTELFGMKGYHAIGIDLISEKSEVSKKTLYKNFASKEILIIEVLKQRELYCTVSLSNKLKNIHNPVHKLNLILEWHDEWFNKSNFTGCLFARAASEFPDKNLEINKIAKNQKLTLTTLIENILSEIIPIEKAKKIAPVIIMILDGATLSVQVTDNKDSIKYAWESISQLIKQI